MSLAPSGFLRVRIFGQQGVVTDANTSVWGSSSRSRTSNTRNAFRRPTNDPILEPPTPRFRKAPSTTATQARRLPETPRFELGMPSNAARRKESACRSAIQAETSSRAWNAESTLPMLKQNADRSGHRSSGGDWPPFVDAMLTRRALQNILVDVSEKWNVHVAGTWKPDSPNASSDGGEEARRRRGASTGPRPFDATKAAVG